MGSSITGCSGDRIKYEDLSGRWDILEAERNGRVTQTLQNVYFEFSPDQKMTTNIFGKENTFEIDYDYPEILTGDDEFKELNIVRLVGDTLEINTRIGDFRYDFNLLKSYH